MQTYLGLDIGAYSIKAIVLKVSFDDNYIVEMREQEISVLPDIDEKMATMKALKTILASLENKVFDSIYTSLGCQHTIMKNFNLNKVKRKDRQKIIESEFDLLGLFNLNDYNIEYHTISFSPTNAKLLGILIQKSPAKQLIEVLTHCELNVRVIDVDNIVFLNLVYFLPNFGISTSRGVELLIDMGHSKTSFTIIKNNKVINARVFNMAGLHLTSIIHNKLGVSYEEAKNLKHNIKLNENQNNYQEVVEIVTGFLEELCLEIKRTIKTINATEFLKIDRVFITGGSSKIDGIEDIFEKIVDVRPIPICLSHKNLRFSCTNNVDFKTFSQCLGIAFRGNLNPVNSKINIRHGDLALISNYEKIISEFTKYLKLAAIVFIVLLSTYFLRYFLFQNRMTDLKLQFQKEIVQMFHNEPRELRLISGKSHWDFDEYSQHALKLVKDNIHDKKTLLVNLSLHNTPITLQVLNQISLSVPKEIYFEVVNFKYQDGIVFFEADTQSTEDVEKIIGKIKSIKILSQVTKKSEVNKAGSNGKLVHFGVSANVLDTEE